MPSIGAVQPVHVATWIEAGTRECGLGYTGRTQSPEDIAALSLDEVERIVI